MLRRLDTAMLGRLTKQSKPDSEMALVTKGRSILSEQGAASDSHESGHVPRFPNYYSVRTYR